MASSPNNPVAIIAKATAADPAHTEGDQVQVSVDLAGNLRTLAELTGSITVTSDATATAAAPSYIEGTANPLSQTLAGNLRVTGVGGTFPVTGTFFQATQPVSIASAAVASGAFAAGSIGSGAIIDLGAIADAASSAGGTGSASAKLRLMTTQLGTLNTTLGSPFQAGGSIGNTTFAVTNAGTFAVQATQSGTWNIGTVTTVSAVTAISNALPAGTNLLGKVGIDQTTAVTTNGVVIAPVAAAAAGIAPVVSTALETGHVIKASAGNLYGLNVSTTTVAGFVLIFNSTTVPAAGAVTPIKSYQVPAGNTLVVGFDPPLYCATGISIAFSSATTPFTKTDSATAFISGDAV